MKPHLQIALALIWREGELLVARRASNAEHLPDVWEFPGGKIEAGETPAQAVVREAREEVGLEIEVTKAREIIEWEYETRCVSLHPFDCRIVGGELTILNAMPCRFVAPKDLNAELFPSANQQLIWDLKNREMTL